MYVRIIIICQWNPSKVSSSDIGKSLLIIIFTRFQGKEYQSSWLGWQNESPSLAKRRSRRYCISSRWCAKIPHQTKAQLNDLQMKQENLSPRVETKELYSHRIKNKRLCIFYSNSFVWATAYFVCFLFEAFDLFVG